MAGIPFTMSSEIYVEQIRAAEKRGAVKALALIEAQYGDERAGELTVRGNVQMAAHDLARRIESGEVTL
jgi:hypothetical protein